MYFLQVLLFNLFCFSILSYCTVYAKHCRLRKVQQPLLYMDISEKSREERSNCIKKEIDTFTFRQQGEMELKCYRVIATTGDTTLNTEVVLQWTLQQFDHDLLVVTEKNHILAGSSSIILNLDRYDDGLIARCSSTGNETHNNISVRFKYKENINVPDTNEDIKNVNITEGQMLRNEFANSIILYNTSDITGNPRVILHNANIFDYITLEDNGTMYAGWENKSFDFINQTRLVKTKWVVYVEPANSSYSLFLLGIGGISFIVIVIIIVVCCKYCRKKNENSIENPYAEVYEVAHVPTNQFQINHPNPTPEEGDYAQIQSQNDRVVYAQIDIRKADKSIPMQDSEPYAKIIGVIRPNKKGQIKLIKHKC